MHPHTNCPLCHPPGWTKQWETTAQHEAIHAELSVWLVNNAHAKAWQTVAERLLRDFTITKKEKA